MATDSKNKNSALFAISSTPALVAVLLLMIGAILVTVGVSLLWSVPAGLIVFGLILLVLGVLLGLTT
jgi:hypothetical protein